MELRARHIVEGFLSGMHRSPYFGQSVEFLQHREYVIGDDLRHVDWKVWARQDRLYVKQFEEDTNLRCTLLVDVSNSMQYGNGPLNKYEYACTVASSLAYLILQQQDAVGCAAFDDAVRARVPIRSKRNHILSIIEALNNNTDFSEIKQTHSWLTNIITSIHDPLSHLLTPENIQHIMEFFECFDDNTRDSIEELLEAVVDIILEYILSDELSSTEEEEDV